MPFYTCVLTENVCSLLVDASGKGRNTVAEIFPSPSQHIHK